jgi:hypothetical protein
MADNLTLRALSLGELLDASFGLYRRLFVPLVFISVATQAIPLALSIYIEASGGTFERPMLWMFTTVLALILGQIGIAASTFLVAEAYLGGSLTPQEGFSRATPFLGRLIVAAFLSALLYAVGLLLFVVPGVIMICALVVTAPALVLENQPSATSAMGRSWQLTKGFRGRIFGAILVAVLLVVIPAIALGSLAGLMGGASEDTALIVVLLLQSLLQLLAYPFFYVLTTLFYYDLRIRKEAYDLEMLASGLNPA